MKNYLLMLFSLLIFSACVKDKPNSPVQPQVQLSSAKKVYITNEGPFQTGNGAVSLYDPLNGSVVENFYKSQNNAELGNVVQSMNYINGHYYIVVNNSNKIVVCDEQLQKTGQINGLMSPRYILAVTNQKAYVSDLYANAINVVDLNSNTKTAAIACYGKTERMVLIYGKVFVTNSDKDYVYVINTITDAITDSIFVGKGCASIVTDNQDKVWVLGSGDAPNSAGRLTKINAVTHHAEFSVSFDNSALPGNLCLNKTKDTLYFLNDGIYRMPVYENGLPALPFIPKGNKNFYGLGVNPNDYSIYAADALDYVQKSNIYIYSASGDQKTVFKAGIIANGFYFE